MHEYPETSDGNMLLKKESTGKELPIDCMRVMLQKTRACPRAKINDPQDAANLMREMGDYERERGVILHLDTKNNVIGVENISIGSLNAAIIHPREALKGAILNSAAHVIFLHNHPSGDKAPSTEDRAITKKLMGAFDSVGIDLLDSIIVGRETYYSFKETGEMFPESKYKESRLGEMRFMDNKDEMYEDIGKNEEDACSIATRAALEVVSERCGREDGTVNDALGAAKASLDHLSSKGKFVFFRDIQKIHRTGEGWEVEIDSTMFAGTLEVAPDGKTKILTGGGVVMQELRPDMKDKFCEVVNEQIYNTIAKMVKNHCTVTKRRTYIKTFRDAANSVDIDPDLLRNSDELERRWNRGEPIQITRAADKEVVMLPKKGDFDREFEDIICHPPKKDNIDITDLSFYIDLGEIACDRPKPMNLSDRDREMFWNIAKSR